MAKKNVADLVVDTLIARGVERIYGAAVVDQLGRPPVLVGASLGGITAMLAEGGSDRVVSSGLVIVDATHRTNPAGVQRIRDFMSSGVRGFASLDVSLQARGDRASARWLRGE